MKNPVLDLWESPEKLEGLLFATQVWDERLFFYSLDSYQLPTLNTRLRVEELRLAVDQLRAGLLHPKSLPVIIEEVHSSIRRDTAARNALGEVKDLFLNATKDADALDSIRKWTAIAGRILDRNYRESLRSRLVSLLPDGRKKRELYQLISDLLVEITALGYARQWLYLRGNERFASKDGERVTAVTDFTDFLEQFDGATHDYGVVLRARRIPRASLLLGGLGMEVAVGATRPPKNEVEERFYRVDGEKRLFLTIDPVRAVDPYSARETAEAQLRRAFAAVRYYLHELKLELDSEALVYTDTASWTVSESLSPMLRRPDRRYERAIEPLSKLAHLLSDGNLHVNARPRVEEALVFHSTALSAQSVENQLINLWTIVEILCAPPMGDPRLAVVIQKVFPLLTRRYFKKILLDLQRNFRRNLGDAFRTELAACGRGTGFDAFIKFVALPEHEEARTRVYALLGNNPLLRFRFFRIVEMLSSGDEVRNAFEAHQQRVRWQMNRIYRTRNVILHEGSTPAYTARLVENLHDYVDLLISTLLVRLSDRYPPDSLDEFFFEESVAFDQYQRTLKQINVMDETTIEYIVFGTGFSQFLSTGYLTE